MDVPLEGLRVEDLRIGRPDYARLRDIFVALEFRVLVEKYTKAAVSTGAVEPELSTERTNYLIVTDLARVQELVDAIRERGWVAIDCELSGPDAMRGSLARGERG